MTAAVAATAALSYRYCIKQFNSSDSCVTLQSRQLQQQQLRCTQLERAVQQRKTVREDHTVVASLRDNALAAAAAVAAAVVVAVIAIAAAMAIAISGINTVALEHSRCCVFSA
jgi:hypothetical protein